MADKPAVNRPGFTPTVKSTLSAVRGKNKYLKFEPNTTTCVRFLPPPSESLFVPITQHFKLKDLETGKTQTLACLEKHGNAATGTKCYLCDVMAALDTLKDDKQAKKHAKFLFPSNQGAITALQGEKTPEGFKYFGPMVVTFSQRDVNKMTAVLNTQEYIEQVPFTDADKGQSILVNRTGSGFDTEYTFQLTNKIEALDTIFPDWVAKYIHDIVGYNDLKIRTRDEQKQALKDTFGDTLDWGWLESEFGL